MLGQLVSSMSQRMIRLATTTLMDGPGAMPDISRLMAMQGLAGVPAAAVPATAEVVKVRCRACSSLQAESAAFCSTCGKPLG